MGLAGETTDTGLGTDTGDGAETGLGADTGDGADTGLGVETGDGTDWADGTDCADGAEVVDGAEGAETVDPVFTALPFLSFSRVIMSPTRLPSVSCRLSAFAVRTAPPVTRPSPSADVAPMRTHLRFMFFSFYCCCAISVVLPVSRAEMRRIGRNDETFLIFTRSRVMNG